MERKEAKEILLKEGRYNYTVPFAKEICKAFGVEFNKKLIMTSLGHREQCRDPEEPRVNICSLSIDICNKLGKKRDEEQYLHSCRLSGAGSWRDAESKAYAMNL